MGRRTDWGTVLLLCLGPLWAGAQEETLNPYLRAAEHLYAHLEFEGALEQLAKAHAHSAGLADDIAIALYEGVINFEMSRTAAANVCFDTALYLNVEVQLPPQVPPKVKVAFESERERIRRELARAKPEPLPAPPPAPVRQKPPPAENPWLLPAAGAVVAAVGSGLLVAGHQDYLRLTAAPPLSPSDARGIASRGANLELAGNIALGVGLGAVAVGLGLRLLHVSLRPDGLAIAGEFP